MTRVLAYLRQHVLAAIALVCSLMSLAGASYAAFRLPAGSVGARELKNHSITPVKFNPRAINGTVRAWAIVGSTGRVIAGAGKPRVGQPVTPGIYGINWGVHFGANCATVATIDSGHSPKTEQIPIPGNPSVPFTAGYAVGGSGTSGGGISGTSVNTFNQQGQLTPLGFDVAVIC
jgi:hypothetical protein